MNNNNKPWYDKVSIWVTLIASICTILGVTIFDNRPLLKNDSEQKEIEAFDESSKSIFDEEHSQKFNADENPNQQLDVKNNNDIGEDESNININDDLDKTNNTDNEKIEVLETHTPNDITTSVSIISWNSNSDIGIDGNMYEGGLKVTMSNMFTSMGSGASNNIVSRITIPLSDSQKNAEEKVFTGTFVLDQSMYGSNSSGIIKIIINNQEVFSTEKMDGNTNDSFPFNVNYEDADTIIIETDATLNGTDFIYGIVNSKE